MMDDKSRAKEAIRLIQWKDGGAHNSHAVDIVLAALESARAEAALAADERAAKLLVTYADLAQAAIRARTATQAEGKPKQFVCNKCGYAGVGGDPTGAHAGCPYLACEADPQPPASPSQEGVENLQHLRWWLNKDHAPNLIKPAIQQLLAFYDVSQEGGMREALSEDAVEAALEKWFGGDRWRGGEQDAHGRRKDMRAAIDAALAHDGARGREPTPAAEPHSMPDDPQGNLPKHP